MKTRRIASFPITTNFLEQALQLPEGHAVIGAQWDFFSMSVRLFVEGPGLEEVECGALTPSIVPIIHTTVDEAGRRHNEWRWNQ